MKNLLDGNMLLQLEHRQLVSIIPLLPQASSLPPNFPSHPNEGKQVLLHVFHQSLVNLFKKIKLFFFPLVFPQ